MKSFYEECLEGFECVVCVQHMHPPIRMCHSGHSYCDKCYRRLEKCPICRSEHAPGLNMVLQEFHSCILFPCRFRESGCQASAVGRHILIHEKNCIVGWKRCPFTSIGICTWFGPRVLALVHCCEVHLDCMYVGSYVVIRWNNFVVCDSKIPKLKFLVYACGEIFSCVFQADKSTDVVRWSVSLVGGSDYVLPYNFEIELKLPQEEIRNMLVLKAPCGLVVSGQEEVNSDVTIPYSVAARYCVEQVLMCGLRIRGLQVF